MPARSLRTSAFIATSSLLLFGLIGCAKKTPVAKVAPPPPSVAPTATLAANPDTVTKGHPVTLTWNTTNANQVSIAGVGTVPAIGSTSVVPDSSTTYVLTAQGPGGSQQASARVTVNMITPAAAASNNDSDELLFSKNVHDIFFDYDKYSVRSNEGTTLQQDARFLESHPSYKIVISGHCDERGSDDYNLALGDNRANTVRDQLEAMGISSSRIRTISYGKEHPFCTQDDEACWQQNRRAHFGLQQ